MFRPDFDTVRSVTRRCLWLGAGLLAMPSTRSNAWTAPAGCPTYADALDGIERLLGRSLSSAVAPGFSADVRIAPHGDGYQAHVLLRPVGSERVLDAAECRLAVAAAIVVVTVAIDPAVRLPSGDLNVPDTPSPTPPPLPEPARPDPANTNELETTVPGEQPTALDPPLTSPRTTRSTEPESSTTALDVELVAGVLASAGTLPLVGLGASVGGALRSQPWQVELSLEYSFPREQPLPASASFGGDLDRLAGALSVAYRIHEVDSWIFDGFVSAHIGLVRGRGFGVSRPGEGSDFWLASGLGGRAAYRLGSLLSIGLVLEGLVSLLRPVFALEGLGLVHESSLFEGRTTLEVRLHF